MSIHGAIHALYASQVYATVQARAAASTPSARSSGVHHRSSRAKRTQTSSFLSLSLARRLSSAAAVAAAVAADVHHGIILDVVVAIPAPALVPCGKQMPQLSGGLLCFHGALGWFHRRLRSVLREIGQRTLRATEVCVAHNLKNLALTYRNLFLAVPRPSSSLFEKKTPPSFPCVTCSLNVHYNESCRDRTLRRQRPGTKVCCMTALACSVTSQDFILLPHCFEDCRR